MSPETKRKVETTARHPITTAGIAAAIATVVAVLGRPAVHCTVDVPAPAAVTIDTSAE